MLMMMMMMMLMMMIDDDDDVMIDDDDDDDDDFFFLLFFKLLHVILWLPQCIALLSWKSGTVLAKSRGKAMSMGAIIIR